MKKFGRVMVLSMAALGEDGVTYSIWDVRKRKRLHQGKLGEDMRLSFSLDGNRFAASGGACDRKLWEIGYDCVYVGLTASSFLPHKNHSKTTDESIPHAI